MSVFPSLWTSASLIWMFEACSRWTRSRIAVGGAVVWCVTGCASPGVPKPPSLHLPSLATRVEARRVGGEVLVTWMTPANTTDGASIRGQITALVCREGAPEAVALGNGASSGPGKKQAVCDPVRKAVVQPGAESAADVLPGELSAGAPRLLGYRVELMNEAGRSGGRPDAVFAAGGEAPPAVGPLTISARRGAVVIEWKAQPSGAGARMELRRKLVATAAGAVAGAAEAHLPAAAKNPVGRLKNAGGPASGGAKEPAREVTLTVTDGEGGDPGGAVDKAVRDLDQYVYVAQRVKTVTLAGHELEMRGVASPPAAITFRDVFPPRAPVGLVSVPGGGFGTAASIDLSWEPNEERDLAGYNVYRREGVGVFAKLNAEPVPAAAYRDAAVQAGKTYMYRVTAVDQRRNESTPSEEIHESLRP